MDDFNGNCLASVIVLTLLMAVLLLVKQNSPTRKAMMAIILAIINVLVFVVFNIWVALGYDLILLLVVTIAYGLGKFKQEFPFILNGC